MESTCDFLKDNDPAEVLAPTLFWDKEDYDADACKTAREALDGYPMGEIGECECAIGGLTTFGVWVDDETFLTAPTREALEAKMKEAGDE